MTIRTSMADAAETAAQGLEAPPPDGAYISNPTDRVAQRNTPPQLPQCDEPDTDTVAEAKKEKTEIAELPPKAHTKKQSAVLDQAINFLSKASPPTLAGIAVGFAGVTYALLGQLGLIIISAVGGAAAFLIWEARNPDIARAVRGENGPDALQRIWNDLQAIKTLAAEKSQDDCQNQLIFRGLDDFRPETREALGALIDAIIKDYVKWWYSPIIPTDHSFPLACRKTLTSYILAVSNRMARKRPADSFLDLLTNSSSIAIAFMSELAAAFADVPAESNMTAVDAVYTYLASNPDSRLANLLNQKQQASKFKMVAQDLLSFMEPSAYNCDAVRAFLREILANTVLENLLQTCSKPEWINGWIVYLLEAGEPDINQAIDVGMQTARDTANNIFADIDGNVGNIGIAKPVSRSSGEHERAKRKEVQTHRKRLSKADEEAEVAIEKMSQRSDVIENDDNTRSMTIGSTPSKKKSKDSFSTTDDAASKSTAYASSMLNSTPPLADPFCSSADASSELAFTPATPRSAVETSSQQSSSPKLETRDSQQFTDFDQIVVKPELEQQQQEEDVKKPAPLTLHNASFTLHDDSIGDTAKIRNKPNWDYLIQVEPSSVGHSGWMIVRRYSDFQTLHEILRRIATVSGATAFTELHKELPSWKMHNRESLRGEMERYLRDACWYQSLAESEGMKRFLEKSQGHTHGSSKSFAWESVGKNMLDVLTIAPKGAMEGGKTLVGGVTGVFGNFPGIGKKASNASIGQMPNSKRSSLSTPVKAETLKASPARSERTSVDSQPSSIVSTQPGRMPMMEGRSSLHFQSDNEGDMTRAGCLERMDSTTSVSASGRQGRDRSTTSSSAPPLRSSSSTSLEYIKLPPPPDEISDDFEPSLNGDTVAMSELAHSKKHSIGHMSQPSVSSTTQDSGSNGKKPVARTTIKAHSKLSEGETRVAVELLFAVINEMYTLSSAWNIRRTLLTAAKSFLLRPGNPSLLTVQSLIQSSVLDAYTADAGVAEQLCKVRENSMPTEEERGAWPAEMTAEEKEELASKARKLLIQSGVPTALMGVMGQAATGEALGRVFDCLQIEEVARGLIFGLMLQGVKVLTH